MRQIDFANVMQSALPKRSRFEPAPTALGLAKLQPYASMVRL